VLESFGTEVDGVPVTYQRGDTIDPAHPSVRRWPLRFGPLVLTHPLPVRRALHAPEVRAE
jgi:hypothetical protein